MKRLLSLMLALALLLACVPALAEDMDTQILEAKHRAARKQARPMLARKALQPDWNWLKGQYVGREDDEGGEGDYDSTVNYRISVSQPSFINIEMKTYGYGVMLWLEGPNWFSGSLSSGKKYKSGSATHKISGYLNPGAYTITVLGLDQDDYRPHFKYQVKYDIRYKLKAISGLTNPDGDNQSEADAFVLSSGSRASALMGACDDGVHYYSLHLDDPAKVRLNYKLYKNQYDLMVYAAGADSPILLMQLLKKKGSKSYAKTINLNAGDYYIAVSNLKAYRDDPDDPDSYNTMPLAKKNGRYDLTVTNLGDSTKTLVLPKTIYVTEGFTQDVNQLAAMKPAGMALPTDLQYSITSGKAVSVDGQGILTALKPGTSKLKVSSASNPALKATANVKVRANGYKPPFMDGSIYDDSWDYEDGGGGVELRIKRMRLKGDYLYVDLDVYNHGGCRIRGLYDMEIYLYIYETKQKISDSWFRDKWVKSIKNRGHAPLTIKFPRSFVDGKYDLRTGDVDIEGRFKADYVD